MASASVAGRAVSLPRAIRATPIFAGKRSVGSTAAARRTASSSERAAPCEVAATVVIPVCADGRVTV